jgi:two-component system chemotaxis response regulator CheB
MRVLVVDDSALMRRWLKQCFAEAGWTVETARSGTDALEKIGPFDPQVVTLDVNMPEMDGLTCLSHIMTDFPRPVIMVSSITARGALATIEALELGAVDYVEKPSGTVSHDIRNRFPEILAKVSAASGARLRRGAVRRAPAAPQPAAARSAPTRAAAPRRPAGLGAARQTDLILIGVSTGGPGTLEVVLDTIDPDIGAPILIAQHMPSRFASVLAERLNGRCAIEVAALDGATPLRPGLALVAGADADVIVSRRGAKLMALPAPLDAERIWHPSVDRMVESALATLPAERLVGVQLTGMGDDGARAMAALHAAGGRTIAEDERTAVIFGMPRELITRGGASHVLPADRIGEALNAMVAAPAFAGRTR